MCVVPCNSVVAKGASFLNLAKSSGDGGLVRASLESVVVVDELLEDIQWWDSPRHHPGSLAEDPCKKKPSRVNTRGPTRQLLNLLRGTTLKIPRYRCSSLSSWSSICVESMFQSRPRPSRARMITSDNCFAPEAQTILESLVLFSL